MKIQECVFVPTAESLVFAIIIILFMGLLNECLQNRVVHHERCLKYSHTIEQYEECR